MADPTDVKAIEHDLAIKLSEAAEICDALIDVAKEVDEDDNYIQSLEEKLQTIRNI